MNKITKRRRFARVALVLFVFFGLFGCGAAGPVAVKVGQKIAEALFKLAVKVGSKLILTTIGHTLQEAIDRILFSSESKDGPVVVSNVDPLKGIYKGTMRIKHDNGNEVILQDPPVVRNHEFESSWTLDPIVKSEVLKKLQ